MRKVRAITIVFLLIAVIMLFLVNGQLQTYYASSPSPTLQEFQEYQAIPTNAGSSWEHFVIGNDVFLVVANVYDGSTTNVDSKIYRWNGANFVEFQSIPTNGALDWEFFTIGSDSYLAVANYFDGITNDIDSKIYKWDGTIFNEFQSIPTSLANHWEFFTIGSNSYLAVANAHSPTAGGYNVYSKIYKWNGSQFVEFQSFLTNSARDWEFFMMDGNSYLVVANTFNGSSFNIPSRIYKWNESEFVEFQSIITNGAIGWEYFNLNNESYLALANGSNGSTGNISSKIYKWNSSSFVEFQSIPTHGAYDWEYFTIGDDAFLAMPNNYDGSNFNIDSKIYKWSGSNFGEFQTIPTNGATDWEFFTIGNNGYLVVASNTNGSSPNINSKIYKAELIIPDSENLVAYYPFNGNSNDESGNSYHGTRYGVTLTTDRLGNNNSAYKFNGSSNAITVPGNELKLEFPEGSDITLSAWIKLDDYNSDHTIVVAMESGINVQTRSSLRIDSNGYPYYFALTFPGELYGPDSIPLNEWHHIAAVHDGMDAKLYLDGGLIAHNPDFGALTAPYLECRDGGGSLPFQNKCVSLAIGAWTDWWGVPESVFNGTIDEVRLYNRPLTDNEVYDLYCEGCSSSDLSVNSSGISFSPVTPNPTEPVTIHANIINLGTNSASGIQVNFYDFDTLLGQTTVSNLASGATTNTSLQVAFADEGYHLVTVKVDPNNSIIETNEDNNIASKPLQVGQPNPGEATIIVQANSQSSCHGGVTNISGLASYDFTNVPGIPDHPVQGGLITVSILDPVTNAPLQLFTGAKTNINGNYSQPILAPALDSVYPVSVSVTDGTLTAETQTTLTVNGACPIIQPEPPNPGSTPPGLVADVFLYSDGILFSNDNPDPGEPISIFAYIYYVGDSPAFNIPVTVNALYPVGGILHSFPIDNVLVNFPNGENSSPVAISIPWTNTSAGAHIVQVIATPPFSQFTGNDKATRLIFVGDQPLLQINKSVSLLVDADGDSNISPGDTVMYTIAYENQGSSDVKNAVITDDYDETFLLTPTQISDGGSTDGGIITWNLGTLAAGSSGFVTYESTLVPIDEFPSGTTKIVNYAFLSGDPTSPMATSHELEVTVNHPPTAEDQSVSTDEDVPLSITLTASDPDNDFLIYNPLTNPEHGILSGTVPNLLYTPDSDFNGSDSFTFIVNDGQADSNVATITIIVDPINDAPQAIDDLAITSEDVPVIIQVTDNDGDVDGNLDPSSVIALSQPSHGSLTIHGNGSFDYLPTRNFYGNDSFAYQVCDTESVCDEATVNITITSVNDDPVCAGATPNPNTIWPPNNQMILVTISGVLDVDGDPLTITIASIFQDEPVGGEADAQIENNYIAKVRAERLANGNGRYYHIGFMADDEQGGVCIGVVRVSVPRNPGSNGAAIDDGPLYDSTIP